MTNQPDPADFADTTVHEVVREALDRPLSVDVTASGVARFEGVAAESITIGAKVFVDIDLATGLATVRAAGVLP